MKSIWHEMDRWTMDSGRTLCYDVWEMDLPSAVCCAMDNLFYECGMQVTFVLNRDNNACISYLLSTLIHTLYIHHQTKSNALNYTAFQTIHQSVG